MKKIFLVLVLFAIPGFAQFATPTPDEISQNQVYWQGYFQGSMVAPAIVPVPTCATPTFLAYRASVAPLLKMNVANGFVLDRAVGFNEAIFDESNWLWLMASSSPHNMVC